MLFLQAWYDIVANNILIVDRNELDYKITVTVRITDSSLDF